MATSDREIEITPPRPAAAAPADVLADAAGASRALRAAVSRSSSRPPVEVGPEVSAPAKLLFGALLVAAAAYAISVLARPTGDSTTWLDGWGVAAFELLASLLIAARAAVRPADRRFSLWLALGGCSWAAGDFYNTAVGGAPTPALNDWLWAGFFPLAYVGVMLLIQRDVWRLTAANFLDGVIAALVTAAALVAFAFHAIVGAAGGSATVVGVNLIYPVGDLLLAGLTGLGIAMAPRGQRTRWYMMTAGGLVNAAGDIAALFPSLGAGHVGYALNAFAWPLALALFSAGIWLAPVRRATPRESSSSGFAVPTAASAVALLILLVGSLNHADQVAMGLATATLLAAAVRFGLALRRLGRLTEERHAELEQAAEAERASREALAAAVRDYSAFAARVADGDLTAVVQGDTGLELQGLSDSLNTMVSGLAEISREIQGGVQEIGSATAEILDSVNRHSVSAGQQSAAITQTSATVSELRATAEEMAERAREVAAQARESVHVSDQGIEAVEAIGHVMEEIRERVDAIAAEIVGLSERAKQIGTITATVNEIADRSNLLALNASIEAARAGEHGRGFAVVAEQVRKLAEQSKAATAQVESILGDVRTATRAAVAAGEQGVAVVDRGLELTGQAGEGIRSLAATIREASDAAEVIAGSSQQQSAGVEQIADAIGEIELGTGQFLDGARQSQRAAEKLERLSGQLAALAERYRV